MHTQMQVTELDGSPVTVEEQVDAASMTGGAAAQLADIRRRHFPAGELPDGGGAIAPTAAGLVPSLGEEEASCSDAASMLNAIDAWARSVRPQLALGSLGLAATPAAEGAAIASADVRLMALQQQQQAGANAPAGRKCGSHHTLADSNANSCKARVMSAGVGTPSHAAAAAAGMSGLAAVASRLAAGCACDRPWAQLHAARACYVWVVTHVPPPWRDGDSPQHMAPHLATWDVGRHIFGEGQAERALQEVGGSWLVVCVLQVVLRCVFIIGLLMQCI
jgi:hypothetical protein